MKKISILLFSMCFTFNLAFSQADNINEKQILLFIYENGIVDKRILKE